MQLLTSLGTPPGLQQQCQTAQQQGLGSACACKRQDLGVVALLTLQAHATMNMHLVKWLQQSCGADHSSLQVQPMLRVVLHDHCFDCQSDCRHRLLHDLTRCTTDAACRRRCCSTCCSHTGLHLRRCAQPLQTDCMVVAARERVCSISSIFWSSLAVLT